MTITRPCRIAVATFAALVLLVPAVSVTGPAAATDRPSGDGAELHRSPAAKESSEPVEIVVRFKRKAEYGPAELEVDHPVALVGPLLASRGIFRFRPTDPETAGDDHEARHLAEDISDSVHVRYAEADSVIALSDNRYHSWPRGNPRDLGRERSQFRKQPLVAKLKLAKVHRFSKGHGVVVAVLDTGVARQHRELTSRLWSGYDYLADDGNPSEVRAGLDTNGNGVVDEAYGHGTFVAGIVRLIAPRARILPMRVLNSDGTGSVFLVAQAIVEAVNRGADVINISLGTPDEVESRLLDQALEYADDHDVHVVAAAGNENTEAEQYPATQQDVLSVSSTKLKRHQISEFANWGEWVDVAAPADRLRGPVPGGRYARWAGTSMAAPQVSAQIALLIAFGEDRTKHRIESITKTTRDVAGKQIKHGAIDVLQSLRRVRDHR